MAGLAELLELLHGARHRFRTVRAEIAERRHAERSRLAMERWAAERPGTALVASAAGPALEPAEWRETVAAVTWAKPDRLRLEVRGAPRAERVEWAEPDLPGGADAHLLTVDAETGVLLRLASLIDGEPFAVTEVRAIAFDEDPPPETWVLRAP